jgi:hypothetical protein
MLVPTRQVSGGLRAMLAGLTLQPKGDAHDASATEVRMDGTEAAEEESVHHPL